MIQVKDLYRLIHQLAPFENADSFDNVGLLVGDPEDAVTGVLISLDLTEETIDEALAKGYNTVLTHHPIIFHPLKSVLAGSLVYRCIQSKISVICAHTNLDKAVIGVNTALAEALGLSNLRPLHTPASPTDLGYGLLGQLSSPMPSAELAAMVKARLSAQYVTYHDAMLPIQTIAVCSGSGGSFLAAAIAAGADAMITGDVKHDVFLSAKLAGITLLDAGHFATETVILPLLREQVSAAFAGVKAEVSQYNSSFTQTI